MLSVAATLPASMANFIWFTDENLFTVAAQ